MNSTQNQKITQITSVTLIIGVDIAKFNMLLERKTFRSRVWKTDIQRRREIASFLDLCNNSEAFQNFPLNPIFNLVQLAHDFNEFSCRRCGFIKGV